MDLSNWTPNKNQMNCESIVMLSPVTKTPVRKSDIRIRSYQSSTSSFSVLPNHITPPSGLTKFIARNPFEADLTNKLHISVISPTVFTKVISPAQRSSPSFTWNIDELALIQPAKIDEFPMQQMHCTDPEIEKTAQEAISRFFSENQIIPSPYHIRNNEGQKAAFVTTPSRAHEDGNLSHESVKLNRETKDSWAQTVLSLPPILPPNVEEALKPYFNFTQDQNCDNEEANSSNSSNNTSLRRKLFSENNDESHDDSIDSVLISPVKSRSPITHNLSPPQSGMFFHGTPLRNSQVVQRTYGTPNEDSKNSASCNVSPINNHSFKRTFATPLASKRDCSPCNVSPIDNPAFKRTFGTPLNSNRNSSPCDFSPIDNPAFNMSCQSIKSRSKSVARLDFTNEMSIEISVDEESRTSPIRDNICKTLFSEEIQLSEEKHFDTNDDEKYSDVTHMAVSAENSIRYKFEDKENCPSSNLRTVDKSKFVEIYKTNFSESYAMQQSNMLSGNYIQQAAFIASQDTGYQTYNSSNMTNNMDSCSTSIKQKLNWDEKITQIDEEVQLVDWSENVKNMISSTPSKYNRCMSDY